MNAVDYIMSRLPKSGDASIPEIAAAFDVDVKTVEAWREAGEFEGFCINKSAGSVRPRWHVVIEGVRKFAARRAE